MPRSYARRTNCLLRRGPSGAPSRTIGFNVYKGTTLVATVNPTDDGTGLISGDWSFSDPNATTCGIQVFNYSQGVQVSYTVYQVGSQ